MLDRPLLQCSNSEHAFFHLIEILSLRIESPSLCDGIVLQYNARNFSLFRFPSAVPNLSFCIIQISPDTRQNAGTESYTVIDCIGHGRIPYIVLCIRPHFNVYSIILGSFSSYRAVSIVATTGFTAVKKHVCRLSATALHDGGGRGDLGNGCSVDCKRVGYNEGNENFGTH